MPWSTMEVSQYERLEIGHAALYLHQLHVITLVDGRLPRFDYTHIQSHAASCSCCFRLYGQFSTVRLGSCFWWLHLQRRSEQIGVCIVVGFQRVGYWQKRLSFCSILFQAQLAEVFVEPWFAAVEVKRWWYRNRVGSPEQDDNETKWEDLRNL